MGARSTAGTVRPVDEYNPDVTSSPNLEATNFSIVSQENKTAPSPAESSDEAAETESKDTWIFQANPDRYRIEDSLSFEDSELWNLNQHADDVSLGDRVLIWISGSSAGIYAVGTAVTEPLERPDTPKGQRYWKDEGGGEKPKPRVRVRYDRVLDKPLLKDYLLCDPELEAMRIIRAPMGTNFPVSKKEWRFLDQWLGEDAPGRVLASLGL
jgi:hypothetical protein